MKPVWENNHAMTSLLKITPPSPSGVVPRERVFRILDGLRGRAVIWVTGPAGAGKTSLVSSYLHARKAPHLWYSLDAGDADISAFFYYLGLGIRQAVPRFRKPMPLLSPEYILGIPVFTRRYFEELFRRLKPPSVIVLDNYHEVSDQSTFHDVMAVGLSCVPEGFTVIVISRNAPPQNLARLRANDVIGLITWDEIRLTREESSAIVRKKAAREVPQDALSLLHEKTDGWVAGLILFIESMKLHGAGSQAAEALTPAQIFDYFAYEIFQKADPDVQALLLKTSFLPSVTASAAEALTGIRSAGRILQRLTDNNYFTGMHLHGHPAYSYHPLFREFLLATARETFTPDEISQVQREAAALLIESGDSSAAAALLIQARDWQGLIPLILDRAPSFVSQGMSKTLMEWIDSIPGDVVNDSPWLLYWKGVCMLPFAPTQSRGLFERAFKWFAERDDEAGALLSWSGAVQTFLFEFHDFGPLDAWMNWLDARMDGEASFPSAEIGAKAAAGMIGALAWRRPNHPEAGKWVKTALRLAQETSETDTSLRIYTNCAFYFLWMGEFAECGDLIEQMHKTAKARRGSPARLITLNAAEAMFHNSVADHRNQAIRSVQEGLEIAHETGVHVFDSVLSIQGLYHSLNEGNLEKVEAFLMKMGAFPGNGHTNSSYFWYFSAWHHFLQGDIPRATAAAKKSADLIEQAGIPISEALVRLTLAQILAESTDIDGACRQLERAGAIAAETGSPYLMYLRDMLEAFLSFSLGKDKAGCEALRRAMSLGRQKGFATMIHFWRPAVMSKLCIRALEEGIETEYVRSIIQKLRLTPDPPPVEVESWPWPLKIYTLGRFSLVVGGQSEKDFSKAKKKPLLMLKALVALGSRDIREETLIDLLWPDAEGDAGHNAFTTTLARLRRMLGGDRTIRLHDGRVSLDNRMCWVDRWLFERLCDRVDNLLKKLPDCESDPALVMDTASRAADLYRGHFLRSDADEVWTTVPRELLRNKYFRLISSMARYSERAGDFEEAARQYRKGLESEPLAEEFYQGLMASCIRLGRHAEAMRVYLQCRQILGAELGIAPSPGTEALRKQIPALS